jgi:tetratricopeptide (TPR) repeat protein
VANRTASQAVELSQRQNWPAAAREWKLAVDRFALLNDRAGEAVALHNLGQAQIQLGSLDQAHNHLEQAASLNDKLGRKEEWWRNQIALLQLEARLQKTNALEMRFEKLTPMAGELRNRSLQGLFLNELALWQQTRGDSEKAAETFQRAGEHFQAANDPLGVAAVLANRAQLYERQQNYAAAIEAWRTALSKFESQADARGITRCLAGLGRSLLAAEKDLSAAEELLRRAARNYRTLNSPKELSATVEFLKKCLMAQGKSEEADRLRSDFNTNTDER